MGPGQQAKRVRYSQGTKHHGLLYIKNRHKAPTEGFVDADYAGDKSDRMFVSGYLLKVSGCTVIWCLKKASDRSNVFNRSGICGNQLWMDGMMTDCSNPIIFSLVPVFEDNQGVIAMARKKPKE